MNEVYVAERLLEWQQPKGLQRYYELRAGDRLIGEMFWPRWFSDEAVGTVMGHSWRLNRRGFFRRAAELMPVDGGPVGRYEGRLRGDGPITFGEERYDWQRRNVWRNEYALVDANGMDVLHLRLRVGFFRQSAEVRVPGWAAERRDLPALIAFGFYLAMMAHQDAAAGAAAAS